MSDAPVLPDDPVFAEPWEARIFALVVELNRQGRFPWKQFQTLLAEVIKDADRPYYLSWQIAAERLLSNLSLASPAEIDRVVAELRPDDRTVRVHHGHSHG